MENGAVCLRPASAGGTSKNDFSACLHTCACDETSKNHCYAAPQMAANTPSPAAAADTRLFGRSEFAPEEKEHIRRLLEQKLGKDYLAERPGAGGSAYLIGLPGS